MSDSTELERFMSGRLDPGRFPHREHVRMGFEMLRVYDFPESLLRYSRALQQMTAKVGKPEVFNQTITVAFLALVAERMQSGPVADFDSFEAAHPDLLDRALLARWYRPERLASVAARRVFLLPEPSR
jgi:hypothetical protein